MQSFKKGKEKNKSLFFLLPSLVAVLSFFSRDSAMRVPINSGRVTCPKIRKKWNNSNFPSHPPPSGGKWDTTKEKKNKKNNPDGVCH